MNELIEKLVASKGADMAQGLVTKMGLSEDQAKRFVPPAVSFLVGFVAKKMASGDDVETADIPEEEAREVAEAAGVEPQVATGALKQLLPSVLGAAKEEAGGLGALGSLLGGGEGGGIGAAAGALKGLF